MNQPSSQGPSDEPGQPPPHVSWPVVLAWLGAMFGGIINFTVIGTSMALLYALWQGEPLTGGSESIPMIVERVIEANGALRLCAGVLSLSSALALVTWIMTASSPPGRVRARLRWQPTWPSMFGWVVLGTLAISVALEQIITLTGIRSEQLEELTHLFAGMSIEQRLLMVPVVAVVAGTAEEVFFRGYALTKLELAGGETFGIIISALLFGMAHIDPIHVLAAMSLGIFLGFAVVRLGSIWPPICAHVFNNAVEVVSPDWGLESPSMQAGLLLLALMVLAAAVYFIWRQPPTPRSSAVW
jgi:uncharacterized protein